MCCGLLQEIIHGGRTLIGLFEEGLRVKFSVNNVFAVLEEMYERLEISICPLPLHFYYLINLSDRVTGVTETCNM